MSPDEARAILDTADLIRSEAEVSAAVRRVADAVTAFSSDANPVVLAVMSGATIFAGHLLPLLAFPLEFDYLHATRYGDATTGGELNWIATSRVPVRGRTVLLVDDILDQGVTLNAIRNRMLADGALQCLTAVFADKETGRSKPIQADFVGLTLPDRFVFGFGMDVRGAWRNLPAIYAVREETNASSRH